MIELVSQIGSKIRACYHIMKAIENWFVPSLLAAGINRKMALFRNFSKNELCNSNGLFIASAFLLSYFSRLSPPPAPLQKDSFNQLSLNFFNVQALCVSRYFEKSSGSCGTGNRRKEKSLQSEGMLPFVHNVLRRKIVRFFSLMS